VYVPTPLIVTVTTGGQPALDAYTTEKVITVPVVADPGLADPEPRDATCEAPLHEAARAGVVANTVQTASDTTASPTFAHRDVPRTAIPATFRCVACGQQMPHGWSVRSTFGG
jgi:hypothetical protein